MWMFVWGSLVANAGTLAGVTLPDAATAGGQSLVLNGLGLREKLWVDVYVGGLYLTNKSSDAAQIIAQDAPRRIVMHFIYKEVTADQLNETWVEGFAKQSGFTLGDRVDRLCSMMETVRAGDEIVLEYVPGVGTTVYIRGIKKGTVEGADFAKALTSVFIGASPPTSVLKQGMLGL